MACDLGLDERSNNGELKLHSGIDEQRNSEEINPKKTIVLTGFYGRGNVGDEALLQCIYEQFRDLFNVHIIVDRHGCASDFEQWYPYNQCSISHQTAEGVIHKFAEDGILAGLIIGGGGLHLGFSSNLAIAAASKGAPIFMIGVDFVFRATKRPSPNEYKIFKNSYRNLFAKFMVRSNQSFENAKQDGMEPEYGADLALNLITDNSGDWEENKNRALIAIREVDAIHVGPRFFREIQTLIGHLTVAGYEPTLIPCAPEDVRFLDQHSLSLLAPSINSWANPRRFKELISLSGLLISVGRLHPIIFAATTKTPTLAVGMPWSTRDKEIWKVKVMAEELGIETFASISLLNRAISSGKKFLPANQERVNEALKRLNICFEEIKESLLKHSIT